MKQRYLILLVVILGVVLASCGVAEKEKMYPQRVVEASDLVEGSPIRISVGSQIPVMQDASVKYLVKGSRLVPEVPGMQFVFVTADRGSHYYEFACLAPANELFVAGDEVELISMTYQSISYNPGERTFETLRKKK